MSEEKEDIVDEEVKPAKEYLFISMYKHPVVIVKAEKRNSDGDALATPKRIYFENWRFTTKDEKLAKHIREHVNFGHYYWEYSEDRPAPIDREPHVSVSRMDKQPSEEETRIKVLEDGQKALLAGFKDLTGLLQTLVKDKKSDKKAEKIDSDLIDADPDAPQESKGKPKDDTDSE